MSEIKFKTGTTVQGKTVNDGDIVMINNTMGSANSDSADDKLGSVYKGSKIVGTTKAKELCLTGEISVSNPVGNIISGDTLAKGTNIEEILTELLSAPVQYPSYEAAKVSKATSISSQGSISVNNANPYFSETVTYTYPGTGTCSATKTGTKYKNGGDTTFTIPTNTTQNFYDAEEGGNVVTSLPYSRVDGGTSWVATWGSSNKALQKLVIDKDIYVAPVMTSDNEFYIPLDSNGRASNKTGKYDEDYSAVLAVNSEGNEAREKITIEHEIEGASYTSYAYMPIYAGLGQIANTPKKIRSGSQLNLELTGSYSGSNKPVLYIPYKYRIAGNSTWNNVGKSEIALTFMNTPYSFTINAGGTSFSSATSAELGSVETISKYWLYNNGAWSESETDDTTKSGVQFLKVNLAKIGNSAAADAVKITITK